MFAKAKCFSFQIQFINTNKQDIAHNEIYINFKASAYALKINICKNSSFSETKNFIIYIKNVYNFI